MAKRYQVLLKRILPNLDEEFIFFKHRAKDVMLDDATSNTIESVIEKIDGIGDGATKVEAEPAINGSIRINEGVVSVFKHKDYGDHITTGSTFNVDRAGHVIYGDFSTLNASLHGDVTDGTINSINESTSITKPLPTGTKLKDFFGYIQNIVHKLKPIAFKDEIEESDCDDDLKRRINVYQKKDGINTIQEGLEKLHDGTIDATFPFRRYTYFLENGHPEFINGLLTDFDRYANENCSPYLKKYTGNKRNFFCPIKLSATYQNGTAYISPTLTDFILVPPAVLRDTHNEKTDSPFWYNPNKPNKIIIKGKDKGIGAYKFIPEITFRFVNPVYQDTVVQLHMYVGYTPTGGVYTESMYRYTEIHVSRDTAQTYRALRFEKHECDWDNFDGAFSNSNFDTEVSFKIRIKDAGLDAQLIHVKSAMLRLMRVG